MKKVTQSSTAIIVTFPDNTSKTFKNIELASSELQLSPSSIKQLCNRKGSKSKTGIQCT